LLDYTTDSHDIRELSLEHFSTDEQRMVLSALKALQRVYRITGDVSDMRPLLESGFHSAPSITDGSLQQFRSRSGLGASVAKLYYDRACALVHTEAERGDDDGEERGDDSDGEDDD
jgi:hypothetical protein